MSTGVWIDSDTGSLVTKEPVHGRVVVPVGDDTPDNIAAQLEDNDVVSLTPEQHEIVVEPEAAPESGEPDEAAPESGEAPPAKPRAKTSK